MYAWNTQNKKRLKSWKSRKHWAVKCVAFEGSLKTDYGWDMCDVKPNYLGGFCIWNLMFWGEKFPFRCDSALLTDVKWMWFGKVYEFFFCL